MTTHRVTVDNVRNNPPIPSVDVRAAFLAIREAGDVHLLQEQWTARNISILHEIFPLPTWGVVAHSETSGNVIVYRRDVWACYDYGFVPLTSGWSHVTPERNIMYARLSERATAANITFWSTQFISGAFSNNYPDTKAQRRVYWNEEYAKTEAWVKAEEDANTTLIGGGDFNHGSMPTLSTLWGWDSVGGGIDWLGHSEGAMTLVTPTDAKVLPKAVKTLDHTGRQVTYEVKRL